MLKRLHVFIEALYARPPQGGKPRPYQPAVAGSDGGNQDSYHPFHRYGRQEGTDDALEVITRYHNDISILHCVSQYPTQPDNLNLKTITYLKQHYGQYHIGFSDHTIGIAAPVVAVGMGAEIIEKHVTIDRRMKGTDQQGSLGPDGVNRMIRDIRIAEHWLGREELYIDPVVSAPK